MERLKMMKNTLVSQVEAQMANLQCVDTKELGEAIDMIKDLEEAIYYCTVVKAMEEKEENVYYYTEDGNMGGMSNGSKHYTPYVMGDYYRERELPLDLHDEREGRSPRQRRMYMETKTMHKDDKEIRMAELEKYAQDLTTDIMEMIEDASPEEKQALQRKFAILANRLNG